MTMSGIRVLNGEQPYTVIK